MQQGFQTKAVAPLVSCRACAYPGGYPEGEDRASRVYLPVGKRSDAWLAAQELELGQKENYIHSFFFEVAGKINII